MSTIDVGPLGQPDYGHRSDTTDVHGFPDTQALLDTVAQLQAGGGGSGGTVADAWQGPYSSEVGYAQDQIVLHNGGLWISTAETTAGQEPGAAGTPWDVFMPAPSGGGDTSAHEAENPATAHPGVLTSYVSPEGGGTPVLQSARYIQVSAEAEADSLNPVHGDVIDVRYG